MDEYDEYLTFELCIDLNPSKKVIAEGANKFDEIHQRELKIKVLFPKTVHVHLIITLLNLFC